MPGLRKSDARRQPGEAGIATATRRHSSTATEAQRARLLDMLREGPRSTLDFRAAGIMQSATRIFELRARGYDIATVARAALADGHGFRHVGVAVYALLGERR